MCVYSSIFIRAYSFIYIYLHLCIGDSWIGKRLFQSLLNMNNVAYKNEHICVFIHAHFYMHMCIYSCIFIHAYVYLFMYIYYAYLLVYR
jgi:hypothetical protein